MYSRPSLVRSIPFWILVVGSIASAAAGAAILVDKVGVMTTTLTDGSATGLEVYVGQTVAVVGAVLVGAGVVGILLALTVAALATLRPTSAEVVEPIDWTAEELDDSETVETGESVPADAASDDVPAAEPAQVPSR